MERRKDPDWFAGFLTREGLPPSFSQVFKTVVEPLAEHIHASCDRIRLVGLCGAQGSGKSTLSSALALVLKDRGLKVATLSLDDLYLSRALRKGLALGVHPLLATRGVPGTHDVAFGGQVLEALKGNRETCLPRFDKAADDPFPQSSWPRVTGPLDVVLFEGWCVGARAQSERELAHPINTLEHDEDPGGHWRAHVNAQLRGPYASFFSRLDLFVFLQAPNFDVVADWRLEQEEKLRKRLEQEGASTTHLMDEAGVRRFISHYERITRALLDEAPDRADVLIRLEADRSVSEVRFKPPYLIGV